jgi:hypothetical protein
MYTVMTEDNGDKIVTLDPGVQLHLPAALALSVPVAYWDDALHLAALAVEPFSLADGICWESFTIKAQPGAGLLVELAGTSDTETVKPFTTVAANVARIEGGITEVRYEVMGTPVLAVIKQNG